MEIQGPAASGKTQVLQFLAMTTCLPRSWKVDLSVRGSSRPPRSEDIAIGGRQKSVVIMDCDGRFSVKRLYTLVRSHLVRRVQEHAATIPALYSAEATQESLHEETVRALSRVHIFVPTSSTSLAASLCSLPSYVRKACSGSDEAAEEVTFLLIDNISAFYWQDRYQAEQDRAHGTHSSKSQFPALRSAMACLANLRAKMGIVTVVTNWAFPHSGDRYPTSESPFFRQHMPRPFPSPFASASDVVPVNVGRAELGVNDTAGNLADPSRPLHGCAGATSSKYSVQITHQITLHSPYVRLVTRAVPLEIANREEPFRSMDQQEMGSMAYVRTPGVENGEELGKWEIVVRQNAIDGL